MYGTAAGSGGGTFEAAEGAAPTHFAGMYGVGMGFGVAVGVARQLIV